jgi:AraC-like DNA-binding protein
MRMSGTFYALSELTAPWGMDLPAIPDTMMFHFVTEGRCWLEVDGLDPRVLEPGTLALVPHGRGHRLVSEAGGPAVDLFAIPREELSERYELIRHGGGGALTRLVCGAVHFDNPAARQLVEFLPRLICVDTWNATQVEWLHGTLRFMASEARQLRPGGETVITRLADVLVIQTLRSWLADEAACGSDCEGSWLRAIQDPQIGRAIVLVHRDPAAPWTVQGLAAAVGMSRSGFAVRFKEVAGVTPLQYVTRWRMLLAASRLQEGDATLAELSDQFGYRSEAAFSRAFKRAMGTSPGRMRRQLRNGP